MAHGRMLEFQTGSGRRVKAPAEVWIGAILSTAPPAVLEMVLHRVEQIMQDSVRLIGPSGQPLNISRN